MAVVATLSKGYDLDYIWKQVDRGPAKDAASYYIQASESGGEPPGRWWGPGAKALGFEPGQRVERQPYDLLFGKRKAPDGTRLGKPPDGGRKAADLYARLLAAEPHATADRRRELRIEATGQHLEEALTRRFGLEWVARDDGHGFEIKGISGEMMRLFSSRRESITADVRARAAQFEQRYGRKPSQRELAHLAQASNFTTRNPKHGALNVAQLHAGWAGKLARTLGVSLASVAPSVWHGATGRAAHAHGANSTVRTELELSRAAQKAVALAQQDKSTWTRADVIKYLGRVLPRSGMNPAAAAALLENLADRALASEFEPVVCLEAPEPAEVPRSLLRADGRRVYQRHGGTRFATRAQLVMEERMLAQARASGAPRLTRAQAARARRRPGAARRRADRSRARRARAAHTDRAARGSGRRRDVGPDRWQAGFRD